MPDAATVTTDQLAQALAVLGLDPPDPARYRSLHIERMEVTAVRYLLDGQGRRFIIEGGDVATETVTMWVSRT